MNTSTAKVTLAGLSVQHSQAGLWKVFTRPRGRTPSAHAINKRSDHGSDPVLPADLDSATGDGTRAADSGGPPTSPPSPEPLTAVPAGVTLTPNNPGTVPSAAHIAAASSSGNNSSSLPPKFEPTLPSDIGRYNRAIIAPVSAQLTFKAFEVDYADPPILSTCGWSWEKHTHPEGAPYYYESTMRVYTDANLSDRNMLTRIEPFAMALRDRLQSDSRAPRPRTEVGTAGPSGVDIVVENASQDPSTCRYYMVDHDRRIVFWIDDWAPQLNHHRIDIIKRPKSLSHIGYQLNSQYWTHWEYFPPQNIPRDVLDELQAKIMFWLLDVSTSRTSTSAFSLEELERMQSQVNHMSKINTQERYVACATGRLLSAFALHQYTTCFGQPHARLNQEHSIHSTARCPRSLFFNILSVLLFRAPSVYLTELECVYVDEVITYRKWKEYMTGAISEWAECNVLAAVVLTATVGLLTIQSSDKPAPRRSLPQILSYCAAGLSVASLASGLVRLRRHRKSQRTATEAASYVANVGLESLALIAALPVGFLIWGVLCFLAALSAICFEKPSLAVAGTVGVLGVVVFTLVGWSMVIDAWLVRPRDSRPKPARRSLSGVLKSCVWPWHAASKTRGNSSAEGSCPEEGRAPGDRPR